MFLRPLYRRPVTDTVTDESIIFITWAFYITIYFKKALSSSDFILHVVESRGCSYPVAHLRFCIQLIFLLK